MDVNPGADSKIKSSDLQRERLLVKFDGHTLTVQSDQVPRGRVVTEVASVLRCRLVLNLPEDELMSMNIAEPLEVALARIAAGLPYATTYAQKGSQDHALVELRVGPMQAAQAGVPVVSSTNAEQRAAPIASIRPPKAAASTPAPSRKSPLSELEDEDLDPDARVLAAQRVPPVGTGAFSLAKALQNDTDSRVREAAAKQLGGGTGYSTVDALLHGLLDEDPKVADASLKSLQEIGDPSIVQALQATLSRRPNPKLATAIEGAIGEIRSTGRPDSELPEVIEYTAPPRPEAQTPIAASASSRSPAGAEGK